MTNTGGLGIVLSAALVLGIGCGDDDGGVTPLDPDTAPRAEIDRFSAGAGTLMVRDGTNGMPGPGEPIDFDQPPFITRSLGPGGELVRYYNFDVQPDRPALLYVIFRDGESAPVEGQLPILDVIPGDEGYSDFWRIYRAVAPADYVANTVTSYEAIYDVGLDIEPTETIVNCPVVPEGSTAELRVGGGSPEAKMAWYADQVVFLFTFEEATLAVSTEGEVPTSPIFVTFNVNPDQPAGGPPSGFVVEPASDQTHNVISTLPGDAAYSPFWAVNVYDNRAFDSVSDLPTAEAATRLAEDVAHVNCPVASIEP